jgi:hypothetical protein
MYIRKFAMEIKILYLALQAIQYNFLYVMQFLTQSKEDVYPVSTLPLFANLSHLELGLVTIEFIFGLLQKSPVLKTLVLALKVSIY